MEKSLVFMYSGQGSQYFNMGIEFFKENKVFKDSMNMLDSIFNRITGESVIEKLYYNQEKKKENFDEILFTHPAIFMVEYSMTQVLIKDEIYPDFLLGCSLGEYTASVISGAISCEDLMKSIIKQVELLHDKCNEGRMLAIISNYELYHTESILNENSELASVNFESHFVVSGAIEGIDIIIRYLKEKGVTYYVLPIKYPFHSTYIDSIKSDYIDVLEKNIINEPCSKIISSMKGKLIEDINRNYLWDVIRKEVNFRGSLNYLLDKGENIFIDLGPSGDMANFAKYSLDRNYLKSIYPIMTPFNNGEKNLEKLYDALGKNK